MSFCKYKLESYLEKKVSVTKLKLGFLLNRKFTSRLKKKKQVEYYL